MANRRDSDKDIEHSFEDLRTTGLLWLINRVVFHPRGFALALLFDGDSDNPGNVTGWTLLGNGAEVWDMGALDEDGPFETVEAFLNSLRP